MNKSAIEWTDYTFDPAPGCNGGCTYCYARAQSRRFCGDIRLNKADPRCKRWPGREDMFVLDEPFFSRNGSLLTYPFGFSPTLHTYSLGKASKPVKVTWPSKFFVCSSSDLLGDWVPIEWIQDIIASCDMAPQHQYIVLTKNPERLREDGVYQLFMRNNFWIGTSITNNDDFRFRAYELYENMENRDLLGTAHMILSIEPMHGPVDTTLLGNNIKLFDWVIVGGETKCGRLVKAKAPAREWVAVIVEQCRKAKVPVFLKNNIASVWGETLIQEYPLALLPQPKPLPQTRIFVERVRYKRRCQGCNKNLLGKPAYRMGNRWYMCPACLEKARAVHGD